MKIDSHHHFWDYSVEEYGWIQDDMAVLKRDFGPQELLAMTQPAGISGVVSVQARQSIRETQWLLDIAKDHELVRGVVGWVPLAHEDVRGEIERWSHSSYLKAVRHVVQDEPDDNFILGDAFNRGVGHLKDYGLVYDILIFAKHLTATIQFVDRHPQQSFVLDHIAKPTITALQFDDAWEKNLRELAKRDNVTCKFSGVVTEVREAEWSVDTIRRYWDVAWDAFGSRRLMYGSDWPVCLLKSDYQRWVATVGELAAGLSDQEQADFWGGNASRVYSL